MFNPDQLPVKNRFHSLGNHFFEAFEPQGFTEPQLIELSTQTADLLGMDEEFIRSDRFMNIFSGNQIPANTKPLAQDYAGHQMGNFNPFLGDGRSVLLFDIEADTGFWEVNIKGVGQTPYCRDFDGRASLAGCRREFEISEKLAKFSIKSSHALCVISDKKIMHRTSGQQAAMVTRIAPCFIRFGTFENYYFQKNHEALQQLMDYVIQYYYPELLDEADNQYALFFAEVVKKTAQLIASWQAAGFVHGMMNTDNQSIIGITLDLGESAFNESLDPDFVSSKSDEDGRYAFSQQPVIGLWNCNVLARALSPIIEAQDLRYGLEQYENEYLEHYEELKSKQ